MNQAAAIYACRVMHQRFGAHAYRFRYRTFSVLLDIDQLEQADRTSHWFSVDRFNLLSFYRADHLPPEHHDLRTWLQHTLARFDIEASELRVRLLCMPRVLGWGFDPLSIWYCEDANGRAVATVCEVHNTFGERHCYVLRHSQDERNRQSHAKLFHVSPFLPVEGEYRFELQPPTAQLQVLIEYSQAGEKRLVAAQRGHCETFNSRNLLRQFLRVPAQTLKVLGAIHWHALRIWWRGARFHRKPNPPLNEVS